MRARHRRPVMYFAGLDAHLKYVTVAVLDRLGTIVLETTVSTREPERLLAVLAPFRPLEVVVETRSEEHTSELQSRLHLVCRLLLEKKKKTFSIDVFRLHRQRNILCMRLPPAYPI